MAKTTKKTMRKGRKAQKKPVAMYKRRIKKYNNTGKLYAIRKYPEILTMCNTSGNYVVYPNTVTALTFGSAVAVPGAIPGVYDIPFALSFKLSDLPAYSEYTSLFDQYKILRASIKVQGNYISGGASTQLPTMFIEYITDEDDAVPPNLSLWRERMGVKARYFRNNHVNLSCVPKIANEVYGGGILSGYSIPGRVWLNAANADVPHYSIKGVIRNVWTSVTQGTSPLTWDISLSCLFKDMI